MSENRCMRPWESLCSAHVSRADTEVPYCACATSQQVPDDVVSADSSYLEQKPHLGAKMNPRLLFVLQEITIYCATHKMHKLHALRLIERLGGFGKTSLDQCSKKWPC